MNKKVLSNLLWRFLERCGAQGVTFVVSIVLARLLDPETYGTIALVTVFITILQVFVDSGFGTALIQKKKVDDLDFSTVFFFNIVMCLALYMGMYVIAPYIADFYALEELVPVIRVMSLSLIVSGVKNVQQAYVSRHLLFKKFFFATIGATICSAAVGIIMAVMGLGIWALVGQSLFNAVISTAILWCTVKWRPRFCFSMSRLKELFGFGWKLLISALLETLYNDLCQLLIGKMYTSSDLAFFNKGKQLPSLVVTNINTSIDSVLLPTMSSVQDDFCQVKAMTRHSIKVSTYVIMPMLIGLAACAEPLIYLLLSDKWLPCVPYMRVFCFVHAFYPIHTANLNAIKAVGRSDLFLKLEVIKKIIGVIAVMVSMRQGVMAMSRALIVTSLFSSFINAYPNKKLLGYSYAEQIKDILPSVALAAVMGMLVYSVGFCELGAWLTLIIQVSMGVVIYVAGSAVLRNEAFFYVLGIVKNIRHR